MTIEMTLLIISLAIFALSLLLNYKTARKSISQQPVTGRNKTKSKSNMRLIPREIRIIEKKSNEGDRVLEIYSEVIKESKKIRIHKKSPQGYLPGLPGSDQTGKDNPGGRLDRYL